MGLLERRKAIEEEIARTQKNKKTEYHVGRLKGQLARIKTEMMENAARAAGAKGGDGFDVRKSGDVRCALVGFPSVGKSSFLSRVTQTESEAAGYEFTTLTCIPGKLMHKGTEIQILDLPGIIEGAAEGKGRGRQVIATARTADMIILMLDAAKAEAQRSKIESELESVGIRLNQRFPNVTFKKKASCSMNVVSYSSTVPQTRGVSEQMVKEVLKDYGIFNADVALREDITVDQFIDVIEGNRKYMPCLYVYNKIDTITMEEMDRLSRLPHSVVLSLHWDLNVDEVIDEVWEHLNIIRIYTKKHGEHPDFGKPFVVKRDASVEHICKRIHKDIASRFKYALVWGTSAKHQPQRVGISHELEDEDVLQIMLRTANE
ncbi:ribosome-interacting GTPase 2 [Leishmania donovani]|uniref:Ribosome-interacting_GTPase_2_-_putative n=3 Tax=Leishmania donovani species complex TaxID=38574 RepID=A0A6L0XW24_LEIIN|nr:putative GTP-binding protein [Leishmania infantum JPCM5]TPP47813.1 TGS domain family protein [Leishmania donovani]CAC9547683.1 ribosome-interacting_GTPase_2_-_putative [Leishmania infantum]CAJ1993348.1 ribosome-interacting GTPase 2 [Leishmania donovani]CAM72424.1 putative GTP-binding protein [Leishmania infantum JPCM5]SUZ46360.1 ribosome-interacting_GTPase_2_-_putative [Leishmania infantum]|eukprot:XP_001469318.1 putative GTP-binding protein [Leishmania infantum JPCM5]